MKRHILNTSILALLLAGCATHEQVTAQQKKGLVVVHHRSIHGTKAVDRIETVNAKGVLSQAVVEVYDIGRLPDGHGGLTEAHRYYRVTQTPTFDLRLPRKSGTTGTGPRSVYTPPNYVPPPNDQRVNNAVAQAEKAKEQLQAVQKELQARLDQDNALREQLQNQVNTNEALMQQFQKAFPDSRAPPTSNSAAAKEAASDVDDLTKWANQQH